MNRLKKLFALLTAGMLLMLAVGCGGGKSSETGSKSPNNGKRIGVAMPTRSTERWISDGDGVKKKLEALGYTVDEYSVAVKPPVRC